MKRNFKIIVAVILSVSILIGLCIYLFYEKTTPFPRQNYWRTGEYYSKNDFSVFYEVKAFRSPDKDRKYDKKLRIWGADLETFAILNQHYTKDKNNVYICQWNGSDAFRIQVQCNQLKNIDNISFYAFGIDGYEYYAQDKDHVYFYGKVVENADSDSFKSLSNNFAIDKNRIYYRDFNQRLHIVKEVQHGFNMDEFLLQDHSVLIKELNYKKTAFIETWVK